MNLTEHFTLEEMTRSEYAVRNGIDNTPNSDAILNLVDTCNLLESIRTSLGKSIHVTSGYRSPEVNKAIGGAATSQHTKGQAADIHVDGMTTEQLFQYILKSGFDFDQLIQEFGSWVHISTSKNNRHQAMRAVKDNGKTVYLPV